MSDGPSKLSLFLADMKRRGVTRLASIYAVVGLGVIEGYDIIGGRFLLPDWTFKAIILITVLGFPVAMILGWIYDINDKKIIKTDPLTQSEKATIKLSWKPGWFSVILFAILLLTTTAFFVVPRPNALGFKQQDWVLMADLENNTGDEVFEKSLLHALGVTINQSRRINIFPRTQTDRVLQRMKMDTVKKITLPIALEIAERENIKVVLLLTISELGGSYVLSTSLINPFTGETIRASQVTAEGKEEILRALDQLAVAVRKDLGDSMQKIHLQSMPLEKATTSSLEALKFLTNAGNVTTYSAGYKMQIELLQKAIELDPEFALAHSNLGGYYYWINDRVKGDKHINLALSQLDRLTEPERFWIEAAVEGYRGNREASVTKWGTYLDMYPNSYAGWYRLGYNYMMLNREQESIHAFLRALELFQEADPGVMINIATNYSKLEEYEQAIEYYHQAFEINPGRETYPSLNHEYGFTYAQMGQPQAAMDVFYKMLDGRDDQQAQGKRSLALLHMYLGQYSRAQTLMHEATVLHNSIGYNLSELRDRLYLCKIYQVRGMRAEFNAELEFCKKLIMEAATEPVWFLRLGILLVRNGDMEGAEAMLQEISTRTNEGNVQDKAAYNLLKGEIELAQGNSNTALGFLETATALEDHTYNLESLAYYYVVVEDWEKAIPVLEKMTEGKSAMGWESQECWINAHFTLEKAYMEAGETEKANSINKQNTETWKEADEGLSRNFCLALQDNQKDPVHEMSEL